MIGGIYPTTVVPTKATPPPVNFDTVNQEQASANRARPRPDAINFGRSTMMEPFGGGSYLRPREKKTSWTLHRERRREKKTEGTWTGIGVAKSRVNLSSRELYARLSSYTEPFFSVDPNLSGVIPLEFVATDQHFYNRGNPRPKLYLNKTCLIFGDWSCKLLCTIIICILSFRHFLYIVCILNIFGYFNF